jgi:putative transposase
LVQTSFKEGRGYYGSPRVQDDLVEWGERVSRKRTIRLMQEDGLKARVRKRYKVTTDSDHDQPIAANLLQQAFAAASLHRRSAESAVG